MAEPERQTATRIRELLRRAGIQPRHDLGQNFLIDLNLLDVIVQAADLKPTDLILEVGTGTGSLTARMAPHVRRVIAVEYDPHMARLTAAAVSAFDNVMLLNRDILRNKNHLSEEVLKGLRVEGSGLRAGTDTVTAPQPSTLDPQPSPNPQPSTLNPQPSLDPQPSLKLVANLPYHVATPVISNLIATELPWTRMVVAVQWELAERMTAAPGTADYSALSVWLQSQCRLEILRRLPPTVFWPKPKVDSAIVQIDCDRQRQAGIVDRHGFHGYLRDIFTQRRKHLIGVVARRFSEGWDRAALEQLHDEMGLPRDIRAEALTVEQLVAYHNRLIG
jgi:16S rRNA (adenine1518-N6/adenine1519-N6)-dimethyltransferase